MFSLETCRALLGVACLLSLLSGKAFSKEYRVYVLAGQSNMDGYGFTKELPEELSSAQDNVRIFHGNTVADGESEGGGAGLWSALRPGHGVGFTSDGKKNGYSERFGVELSLAAKLRALLPDENIALIKYSRGGTSIDAGVSRSWGCWEPDFEGGSGMGQGINQYDHFLATLRKALEVRDIDGDGEADRLIPAGIAWMQGESDAFDTEEIAARYETNLKRLMDLMRAALRVDDLPIAIGRIADSGKDADGKVWDHGDIVRQAQSSFCEKDSCAALASTDSLSFSDPYHYDSKGYLDLGRDFAQALYDLRADE